MPTTLDESELSAAAQKAKGNWKQFKGRARQKWGKLTDDQLDQVRGNREELAGLVQESYGLQRDEAERQVDDWGRELT